MPRNHVRGKVACFRGSASYTSSSSSSSRPSAASAAAPDWHSQHTQNQPQMRRAAFDVLLAWAGTGWMVARQRATQRMRSCGVNPAATYMGCTHRLAAHSSAGHAGHNMDHGTGKWAGPSERQGAGNQWIGGLMQ
ncbi:hypothetical protein VC83_07781 [Pseudogymnoascus destructans]|uniref:Uncharacterized protein n=2 Tax=Pseudogymnoascus destructans TaxID=655981 RepID=L8FN11_PSED2|nr:uncharacterized protein VC83_07781 [Pseudogymnoascus destructans]ELR02350.1 hypothetical protein GMDG_05414 [Pseudogymnoascus destructans 20631-21]OAF55772.1 hypothetical protein VC83_07781 [Pseudogymnoascus destructans]